MRMITKQPISATTRIWVDLRHQYGISWLVAQTSVFARGRPATVAHKYKTQHTHTKHNTHIQNTTHTYKTQHTRRTKHEENANMKYILVLDDKDR